MKRMKELRGTINLREQFWVDLKNSQWAKDYNKHRDNLIVKIMSGEEDMSTNEEMAKKIGKLVDKKNKAYGDSFNRAHKVLTELYPRGIIPKDYKNMLVIIRVIDKLFRVANDQDAFREDPWQDIVGYGLLACGKQKKEPVQWKEVPEDIEPDPYVTTTGTIYGLD